MGNTTRPNNFALLIAVLFIAACATTSPRSTSDGRAHLVTMTRQDCPSTARSPMSAALREQYNFAAFRPLCTTSRPPVPTGQHLTAIEIAGDTNYMFRIGASTGRYAPQSEVMCYLTFASERTTTVYLVTPAPSTEFIVYRITREDEGDLRLNYGAVEIPQSIQVDGRQVATHVACSRLNIDPRVTVCSHVTDSADD